jgi:hypothetical protein
LRGVFDPVCGYGMVDAEAALAAPGAVISRKRSKKPPGAGGVGRPGASQWR